MEASRYSLDSSTPIIPQSGSEPGQPMPQTVTQKALELPDRVQTASVSAKPRIVSRTPEEIKSRLEQGRACADTAKALRARPEGVRIEQGALQQAVEARQMHHLQQALVRNAKPGELVPLPAKEGSANPVAKVSQEFFIPMEQVKSLSQDLKKGFVDTLGEACNKFVNGEEFKKLDNKEKAKVGNKLNQDVAQLISGVGRIIQREFPSSSSKPGWNAFQEAMGKLAEGIENPVARKMIVDAVKAAGSQFHDVQVNTEGVPERFVKDDLLSRIRGVGENIDPDVIRALNLLPQPYISEADIEGLRSELGKIIDPTTKERVYSDDRIDEIIKGAVECFKDAKGKLPSYVSSHDILAKNKYSLDIQEELSKQLKAGPMGSLFRDASSVDALAFKLGAENTRELLAGRLNQVTEWTHFLTPKTEVSLEGTKLYGGDIGTGGTGTNIESPTGIQSTWMKNATPLSNTKMYDFAKARQEYEVLSFQSYSAVREPLQKNLEIALEADLLEKKDEALKEAIKLIDSDHKDLRNEKVRVAEIREKYGLPKLKWFQLDKKDITLADLEQKIRPYESEKAGLQHKLDEVKDKAPSIQNAQQAFQKLGTEAEYNARRTDAKIRFEALADEVKEGVTAQSVCEHGLMDLELCSFDSHVGQYLINENKDVHCIDFARFAPPSIAYTVPGSDHVYAALRSCLLDHPHALGPMPESVIAQIEAKDADVLEVKLKAEGLVATEEEVKAAHVQLEALIEDTKAISEYTRRRTEATESDKERVKSLCEKLGIVFVEDREQLHQNLAISLYNKRAEIEKPIFGKVDPRALAGWKERIGREKQYIAECKAQGEVPTMKGLQLAVYSEMKTFLTVLGRMEPEPSSSISIGRSAGGPLAPRSLNEILKMARTQGMATEKELQSMESELQQMKDLAVLKQEFRTTMKFG